MIKHLMQIVFDLRKLGIAPSACDNHFEKMLPLRRVYNACVREYEHDACAVSMLDVGNNGGNEPAIADRGSLKSDTCEIQTEIFGIYRFLSTLRGVDWGVNIIKIHIDFWTEFIILVEQRRWCSIPPVHHLHDKFRAELMAHVHQYLSFDLNIIWYKQWRGMEKSAYFPFEVRISNYVEFSLIAPSNLLLPPQTFRIDISVAVSSNVARWTHHRLQMKYDRIVVDLRCCVCVFLLTAAFVSTQEHAITTQFSYFKIIIWW